MMFFIWDENKNQSNKIKHGLSFEQAKDLFYADNSLYFKVKEISGEQRYAVMGFISDVEMLCLCIYVKRKSAYRIISARVAHENERKLWQKS